MLITDVLTRLVEFPLDAPFHPAWARGRNMAVLQMVLIEVETDEGITGIGAAHAGPEAIVAIDRFVKPYWVGEDPLAVERLTAVLRDAEILGPPVYCMEIPLWDIIGKRAGLPVYQLWGGYSSRVRVYCATAEVRSPEERVESRAQAANGVRCSTRWRRALASPDYASLRHPLLRRGSLHARPPPSRDLRAIDR